ncbi:MAG: hypothetical protein SGPRY_012617 [Prymnesium sp.]
MSRKVAPGPPLKRHSSYSSRSSRDYSHLSDPLCGATALASVRFPSSSHEPALWAHVPSKISQEDLEKLITVKWKLEKPSVVLSIIGSEATLDDLSTRDQVVIERGLMEVLKQTGAWMITSGVDAGVPRLVGRMLRETEPGDVEQLACVGVVATERVFQSRDMYNFRNKDSSSSGESDVFRYPMHEALESSKYPMQPNHTHFLMIDCKEGENHEMAEREFRSKLQKLLCPPPPPEESSEAIVVSDDVATAMVLVVIGGELSTLKSVIRALEDNRPVVVLPDSGGAALEIYQIFQGKGGDGEVTNLVRRDATYVKVARDLLREIKRLGKKPTGFNQCATPLTLEPGISFFRVGNKAEDDGLNDTIMKSLLNDFARSMDAIRLAVKWRNPSIIKFQLQETLEDDRRRLASALEAALLTKSADVVRVLLRFNADCCEVSLNKLFEEDKDTYQLFEQEDSLNVNSSVRAYPEIHDRERDDGLKCTNTLDVESVESGCTWGFAVLIDWLEEHVAFKDTLEVRARANKDHLQPVFFDLMMWAVLVGEQAIARELWGHVDEPLHAALIASLLCRQVAVNSFGGAGFEAECFLEWAYVYESWARGLVDCADLSEARLLLLATSDDFPRGKQRSVIELATEDDEYACKGFLQHRHCKAVVREVYSGFAVPEPQQPMLQQKLGKYRHPVYYNTRPGKDWLELIGEREAKTRLKRLGIYKPVSSGSCSWVWWLEGMICTPKVKFVSHSVSSALFLLLFAVQLCGTPWEGMAFMWRSGVYLAEGETGTTSNLEYVNWFWTFCRIIDEVKQMIIVGHKSYKLEQKFGAYFEYFRSVENLMELTLYACILTVAILRIYAEDVGDGIGGAGRWEQLFDWCRTLYAIAVILAFVRFIEVMKVNERVGVLYIAVLQMTTDIKNW